MALAPTLATVWDLLVSILGTLIFDGFVLGLMVVDGFRVQSHRVQIARQLPLRLSIGRDNPIILSVKSGARPAKIQIRDYYPSEFGVSKAALSTSIQDNSTQELTYTVHPRDQSSGSIRKFRQIQKGVLVLDTPVNQITDQLVDRYLQLKARNQL